MKLLFHLKQPTVQNSRAIRQCRYANTLLIVCNKIQDFFKALEPHWTHILNTAV